MTRRDARSGRRPLVAGLARRTPLWVLPTAVTAVLCLPGIRLGYFWDDYYFLTLEGTGDPLRYALPHENYFFYRPVSQFLYFLPLRLFPDPSGVVAHLMNLAVLLLSVAFLVVLVTKLRGPVAGMLSGLVFATLAPTPSLVAWVSCNQDLLAIGFLIPALLLRHARREWAAVACAMAALFSKETALGFFPVLVFWDRLVGRSPARTLHHAIRYGAVAGIWLLSHAGLRKLLQRGFEYGATGYVGLMPAGSILDHLGRYLLTVINLPATGLSTRWPAELGWIGFASVVLIVAGLWFLRVSNLERDAAAPVSTARVVLIGVLLLVPTLILPAFLVLHWAAYFMAIPAIGVAIIAGTALATARPAARVAFFLVFVPLGIWCRGIYYGEQVAWSEQSFVLASRATGEVERNFKRLYPELPKGSQALVSVTSTGTRGIASTLLEGHALQVWYRDPTLITRRAERYVPRGSADHLVRVTSQLAVVAIDPDSMRVQWSGAGTPDPWEVNRPIRNYARGLAAAGRWDRAVGMLERLSVVEQGMERAYDVRLIAMLRLAQGKDDEAEAIMDTAYVFSRDVSMEILKKLFTESSSSPAIDSCAFQAFGLSPADPEVVRYLMRKFWAEKWVPESVHFASRLQALAPGDAESAMVLAQSRELPRRPPADLVVGNR